ncbi:MAG TPA: cytochrome P450 [Solirubrobacteraceae bacterium]|nr:cytochrome P450 [Solirubrobacteraceae bacterium]
MAATTTSKPRVHRPPATERQPALPPGPRLPVLAQTLLWAFAPTWLLDRCAREVGEAFTLTFWPSGLRLAMLSDPQAIKTVFTAPADVAPSGARMSPIAPVLGASSVLILTGPEHMRQRKLLLPPFHGERMLEYEQTMAEATRANMATWPLGRAMRLQRHTRLITLEVILRAVFGVESERMGPLKAAITDLFEPPQLPTILRALLRGPRDGRPGGAIGRGLDHLDVLLYEEIARRRAASDVAERADILSLLLGARDEDGQAMRDEELRDELVTLLLAGHETTSTSVAWAVERLARHPQKLARLVAEIDAGEGDEYLTAVVHETLRVRPVVPIVVRVLTRELEVGGRKLPAGTRVVPCIYLTNRNPRVYDEPDAFRPERFLGDEGGQDVNTFAWIPFGGGIRRCIGASFALLEMKVLLRTMLAELEPRPADGRRLRLGAWSPRGERIRRRAVTLVPAQGASVVWQRRGGSRGAG